jgi:tetratricopeptide (TPR) repeat protein
MTPSYRVLKRLLAIIPAVGLFLLISANPLAQSPKLPVPGTYVSDFASVIDSDTKTRLENLLQKLKDKSKVELYVVTVETTGDADISRFSQQLAQEWNIGGKTSRTKTVLLVISTASKTSYTQFTRTAQAALPEGVFGDMLYRMQGSLADGRFAEAVDSGVRFYANALAEKLGFNVSDLETTAVAANSTEAPTESPKTVLVGTSDTKKGRPRVVSDDAKAVAQATPPVDQPRSDPTPTETPAAEPVSTESPKSESTPAETPKIDVIPEAPKSASPTTSRPKPTASKTRNQVSKSATKLTAAQLAEKELDEIDEVELTLTKPLPERAVKLKEFLDTHPDSKARPRATELLISTHAALGDQKLKDGDVAGGVEQLLRAIDEADLTVSDKLFTGVIAQIPTNLYLRGEREPAFNAAQNIEAKFGSDPKRLLAVAGFYMGVERATDTVRVAEKVVKLAPDLADAHRMLAVGYHISLRLDDAIAEYKKTLELDPSSKVSRGSLADLYRASGKTEEALALYNEQLTADPNDKAARAGKVVSLLELSRTDEANSALEAALADEPRNLPLLAGTAYWYAAHENYEKASELANKAVAIEPRYTWAQIALGHALLGLKRPLDAERAMRFARQYGKFPTLTYELANVLFSMGLYDESAEVLRESFTVKDGQIHTYLAGHLPATESGFLELLAPERRAGIYQPTSANTAADAKTMKALLAFNTAITASSDSEKINEEAAIEAAKEFAAGTDSMRAFRQVYAAGRLLRRAVGINTALDLIAEARKASDDALKVPVLTLAVQADEFRDLRAAAISAGSVPDVAPAPPEVMANIFNGRLEDLEGWALFNQEKYTEAIPHLKKASEILPAETPAWRTALWHQGVVLEQSDQKQQALEAYIRSYKGGPEDSVRRSVIEQLYKKVNGSVDGLAEKLSGTAVSSNSPAPAATPEATPTNTESAPTETAKAEPTATPAPASTPAPDSSSQPMSDEALKNASSRLRANVKITGRILDGDKVGIANVVVVLISPSGTVLASTTDNEGNYSFKVAPSQKTYRIIPSKEGYNFSPIDRTFSGLYDDQKQIDFLATKP